MLYIQTVCPLCSAGAVGFWRCNDGASLVMLCDECDAVWLHPESITLESALFPSSPDFAISGLTCSLAGAHVGWAERHEVHAAGWDSFIVNKGDAGNAP